METINTEYGTLTLTDEVITVADKPYPRNMRLTMGLAFTGGLTAILFLLNTDFSTDGFFFVVWLLILLVNLITGLLLLRLTFPNTIMLEDVKAMKYRAPFGNGFIDIKLQNGRIRRVAGLRAHDSRIKAYIAANFPT